uniref:Uncharacterized protein n=1 Tax=Anguilla anguilla TaxID=7936 RepID=A0A0E9U6K3_ANGAN
MWRVVLPLAKQCPRCSKALSELYPTI